MKKYISVYLDELLVGKIDDIARKEERSRNYIINEILNKHFLKNK